MKGFTLLELLTATIISSIIFSFIILVSITGFRTLADDYRSLTITNTRNQRLQQEAQNIILENKVPTQISINQVESNIITTYSHKGDPYEKTWRLR